MYGDTDQGIERGTIFREVPDSYCCPVCEAPKKILNGFRWKWRRSCEWSIVNSQ
ncbi:rubredoxin [Niabella hibiscisoli]|uniref:rubredoxin n=1 Tax=Niabella hibiscisoli TaxID=1825928 RepID=UPI00374DD486